ncbi:uncharacterized protein LOC143374070 isoform X2 [Andrena cerasifolii]|uniref:uncharacterized protein LOC143374070 isoform X2 n=1 Tax=Andrena cerasifolii TaxID=2819439 RepID=UPI0040381CA7
MPPVSRKAGSSKKASSKAIPLPGGKENVRPSVTGRKVSLVELDQEPSRRRVSLSSNDETNKGIDGAKTRAITEASLVKKTPFHIHCDEKNVEQRPEVPRRSRIGFRADSGAAEERRQVIRGLEAPRLLPQKRSIGGEAADARKLLPSKIPRRSRSTSAHVEDAKAQGASRRSASVDVKIDARQERWHPAAASKFGWGSGLTIDERTEQKPTKEGVGIPLKTINSRGVRTCRGTFSSNNITLREPTAIDKIKARLLGANETGVIDGGSISQAGSLETPDDYGGLPLIPLKGVVRRSAKLTMAQPPHETREGCSSKDREIFPFQLLYHMEYHEYVPIVEREREERSPRLSENFLGQHINAEQRKLVVIFLIRLGTHCQYPSFVIYQAVKLFDAAMDRIRVKTTYIQLTALASLWLALKRQQNFHKIPTATTILSLAKDLYLGREDLLMDYERKILIALDFNVTFADAFSLFAHYLVSCKCYLTISEEMTVFLYHSGGYLIDLTLLDENFCRLADSLIALTAMELSLGLVVDAVVDRARPRWLFWRGLLFAAAPFIANKSVPLLSSHSILSFYPRLTSLLLVPRQSRFQDEEIDQLRVAMLRRVLTSGRNNCGFDVVYKKYSRSRHGKISVTLLERASRVSGVETFDP